MHILMIRFSSMGDVVLQTATINWLRSLFGKELKLSFVTSKEFVSLVDSHPGINHVVSFDRRGGETHDDLLKKLDELGKIDLIMDLHATMRSFRLRASFWSVPALVIDKRRWERFLLTKLRIGGLKKIFNWKIFGLEPQVERIVKDLESLFGETEAFRKLQESMKRPHGEVTTLSALPKKEFPRPYIVIAPSASFAPKRWSIDSFVKLTERLLANWDVVVLAGPSDDFCQSFNELKSEKLHNLQGKTSLAESMSVLSTALLCVGNDSGMNHIAEAYGVPCVTLFGPTDPRFGFAPHGKASSYLSKDLWCKPCSTTGSKPCFRERHFCMEMISVDEVYDSIARALS